VLRGFWLSALIAVGLTGCRVGYDLLDSPLSSGGSGSEGSNGRGGVNPSTGGSTASDAGDSGVGASLASGGTGSVATGSGGDSAGAGDSLGDAGQSGSGTGCAPAVPAATWAFDQTVEAWQLSLDSSTSGTLVWTGATGDPTPGALQLDATINGKQAVRVLLEQTFPDLTGKTLYARVFLDSGSGVGVKPFVQTGVTWAEGPAVALATKQWTCLNLDLANPTTTTSGAVDPTDVRRIGVVVYGATTFRLYTDYVTY
jgi:hypothetical protein